ncbi:uncharacterized protein LOC124370101 isoform X1 [Homalodisca vitripennis]|uniref:uncharacterized protein LOC124370101 isoform X1 n=1 Tax=Homalodisca vitripennis TaxID=197043 RepID=UPI001EEC9D64|nr:uncharacterized protein LOC124370101 isoform X1 [Homalodisca vitripennis]
MTMTLPSHFMGQYCSRIWLLLFLHEAQLLQHLPRHTVDVTKAVWANVDTSTPASHHYHHTVRKANCTRQDIERHRLYAGSTGSFADCEEYAHLTSLRHDLTGCGVTGLRSDCDTISQTFLILVWPYSNI